MRVAEFAKSIDQDVAAHDEPPHLALHCLPSCVSKFSKCIISWMKCFLKFCGPKFCHLHFGTIRIKIFDHCHIFSLPGLKIYKMRL